MNRYRAMAENNAAPGAVPPDVESLSAELAAMREQVQQLEKMASIGQLLAGITHEINNPLGFIQSNLMSLNKYANDILNLLAAYEVLERDEGAMTDCLSRISQLKQEMDYEYLRDDLGDLVKESLQGIIRIQTIIKDMKTFSRSNETKWGQADLNEALDRILNIIHNETKYRIQVHKEYGALPKVECSISQLDQVFLNILINAVHAIDGEGQIRISTRQHSADKVLVEIADTGKGISKEHIDRIFEPFFTTKERGKGTGLGLSLSFGIIKNHKGTIEVESTPGVGTCFRITLPVTRQPTDENI